MLIKLSLVSSSCLSSHQPATPLTPAVVIAQNIWTTLGHDAPTLSFFLLRLCVNICTADPARESPVPCKSLQFLCVSPRSLSSDRFVESRRFCLRLNLFVGFSFRALMPSRKKPRGKFCFWLHQTGSKSAEDSEGCWIYPRDGRSRAQTPALSYFLHQQFWPLKNEMHFSHSDF